jgi:predicted lysophospholipase L1 biosynthesis ABC-type transport system permease subunit
MAFRELRASWARLLFFFICVAIGVGAIVTLRSIIQNVRGALAGEARAMIAADVLVQTNRPWTEDLRTELDGGWPGPPSSSAPSRSRRRRWCGRSRGAASRGWSS